MALRKYAFNLDVSLMERLENVAKELHITKTAVVSLFLSQALDRYEKTREIKKVGGNYDPPYGISDQ